MIIVAGHLIVNPDRRRSMLERHQEVISAARAAPGCLDFCLAADPIEPDRVHVYERWETVAAVERFRGSGPSDTERDEILDAHVRQYNIAASTSLT